MSIPKFDAHPTCHLFQKTKMFFPARNNFRHFLTQVLPKVVRNIFLGLHLINILFVMYNGFLVSIKPQRLIYTLTCPQVLVLTQL